VIFLDDFGRVASTVPVPDAELTLRDLGVTTVHLLSDRLHEPSDVTVRIMIGESQAQISDARLEEDDHDQAVQYATIDRTPVSLFESIARTLTPLRLSMSRQDEATSAQDIDITDLLGISDITMISPETAWQPRSPRDFLRVPIGLDDFGAPILLDLKESAHLGMGPHGICIGATGSGQERDAAYLDHRTSPVAPARGPQHGAGRLQGRCCVRTIQRPAACGRHHRQPCR
jgi:DNA segregation ATPase FtsK/SpoIIIE, S-DNA-T family